MIYNSTQSETTFCWVVCRESASKMTSMKSRDNGTRNESIYQIMCGWARKKNRSSSLLSGSDSHTLGRTAGHTENATNYRRQRRSTSSLYRVSAFALISLLADCVRVHEDIIQLASALMTLLVDEMLKVVKCTSEFMLIFSCFSSSSDFFFRFDTFKLAVILDGRPSPSSNREGKKSNPTSSLAHSLPLLNYHEWIAKGE